MKASLEKLLFARFMSVLGSLLVLVLTGCNNDNNKQVVPRPVAVSYVSWYHASPNAQALNVFLDNQRVNYNPLQFADYTSYLNFYAGHRNIRVSPFNADNVIIDTTLTFTEGQAYSLFYVNRVANI